MHHDILNSLRAFQEIKTQLKATVLKVQVECKHTALVEVPYKSDCYGGYSLKPFRLCTDCGLAEEGWSYHYLIPTNLLPGCSIPQMDRDYAYRLRIGAIIAEEHRTHPLVPLQELLPTL